ncbi:MAG: lipopolysaccharide heptosyltransferase [Pseudomonadota bacterium]|jgi:ADP-heptose:LPS heptosyltransferase
MSEGTFPPGGRILIILLGALGDVVRGLAVVNAIKRNDPSSHITWLVEPASSGIVSLHPGIDEVIVFQRKAGLRGVLSLRKALSTRTFDCTLDLQRHLKSGFFSWLSGSPLRIGFHPDDTKEGNWIFNTEYIESRGDSASKIDHYLSFVKALGLPIGDSVDAGLSHISLGSIGGEWADTLQRPYIGVILGSSRYSKDWPLEGYQGLLERFNVPGIESVVLLGDGSKVEMAQHLEVVSSSVRIVNAVGKTNLRELVGIIHGARACIGPDSGPGHIAGALGVPHVTLFGPTPAGRNAPRGSESLSVVSSIGCAPCRRRVCPGLDKLCMRLISPELVLERVRVAAEEGR